MTSNAARRVLGGLAMSQVLGHAVRQRSVAAAISTSDSEVAVVAYLELAKALVDDRDPVSAISQLETGIELLSGFAAPGPVWRLQLTLAALYDGNGQRERACRTTRAAHAQASGTHSTVGRARSHDLLQRLLHGTAPARRS